MKGFATLLITILILTAILGIGLSLTILTLTEHKISRNIVQSSQAYYVAEAGIEDALLRLAKNLTWSSASSLTVGEARATTTISDIIGGARTIISEGEAFAKVRKVSAVYEISTEKASFYYGAQVGEGGIEMQDTSKIDGNVFSNGNVVNLSGNPEITGTVKVAKTGNEINGMIIGKDAYVDTCKDSKISGTLTYRKRINCKASVFENLDKEIATTSLSITEEQIQEWKNEALSGGTTTELILSGKQEISLGPKKIEGRLIVQNQAKLNVTGTLWITGEITIQDNAQLSLDKNAYGNRSGVILNDQRIVVQNNAKVSGSGEAGSYLMLLSTLSGGIAIIVQNSPILDIIYASQGRIQLQDSIRLREVSGWGLKLQNKATVIYEAGLADISFTSGPGGSWKVTSWKEIE